MITAEQCRHVMLHGWSGFDDSWPQTALGSARRPSPLLQFRHRKFQKMWAVGLLATETLTKGAQEGSFQNPSGQLYWRSNVR